jgi:hypothetical protein
MTFPATIPIINETNMKFTLGETKTVYEPAIVNFAFGVIGLSVIWMATHNWIAILGGFIAALHFQITIKHVCK